MADWTPKRVEERLIEAADVLRHLPEAKVQGYFSIWPEIVYDFGDMIEQEPQPMRRPLPSAAAISRMDETLTWIHFLAPEDGRLVWARAENTPWKAICWRFGVGRATAHRRWQYGISLIVWRLNGRAVPAKRSREFLVERVRSMSSTKC
ncbi:MAG: hypothetical protein A3G18_09650 [Rhodospirillales bacterium RIFCSPLOWO2_12_FULL_58_28]|nr:MAG: hypothetical protein A3H92_06260 [Rhodospirillales bacterium RIFCSPLOWO2_02_FULL_58_16]OHC78766.1 MAG: hypothetical protein A3G18_09650 [Rhodospirillales bacterium RIFCSPLOWO2_12_FULL_58_28]